MMNESVLIDEHEIIRSIAENLGATFEEVDDVEIKFSLVFEDNGMTFYARTLGGVRAFLHGYEAGIESKGDNG